MPGSDKTLTYDQLVIATGSRSTTSTVPWKILDSYDETVSLLDSTRERVQAARDIVVAGAGATGVEVSGELGFEYGKTKTITLLCGGPSLLDGDSVGAAAKSELSKLHVKIRFGAKVAGTKELADGRTEISLEGGETITTDLYLATMGMKANSEMMDGKYLTDKGYVAVDEFYRVKGLENEGVWALGDVVSIPRGGFLFTQKQVSGIPCQCGRTVEGASFFSFFFFKILLTGYRRPLALERTYTSFCKASVLRRSSSCQWTSWLVQWAGVGALGGWAPSRCYHKWSGLRRDGRWGSRGCLATLTELWPRNSIAWTLVR